MLSDDFLYPFATYEMSFEIIVTQYVHFRITLPVLGYVLSISGLGQKAEEKINMFPILSIMVSAYGPVYRPSKENFYPYISLFY